MSKPRIALLHYSASPVVGGVEAVLDAHAALMAEHGYTVTVIAGRGEQAALPQGVMFQQVPLMDSQHPQITAASAELQAGHVPAAFDRLHATLYEELAPLLAGLDTLIVHNVYTKHFNLPLTAALFALQDAGIIGHCLGWCHDFTWTSPNSRDQMHEGPPWDLLRTMRQDITYVVVSGQRQRQLAGLFGCDPKAIHVVYNGVDPALLLGLSHTTQSLARRMRLFEADLILLMPVRVTRAKHIEFAIRTTAGLKAAGLDPRLVITGPPDPHDEASMAYFRSLLELRQSEGVTAEVHFVYESGPDRDQPFTIELPVVGELYRLADLLFMPSHREGFGMPVLEAGLSGLPIIASRSVPAAVELASEEAMLIDERDTPDKVAAWLRTWIEKRPERRMRRVVRQGYTWEAIFRRKIEPLLQGRTQA